MAEEMGATHFINADREDSVKRILEITSVGADYSFEIVGFPSIVQQAFNSVRPGGTAVMVALSPSGSEITVATGALMADRALIGASHGAARPRVDFPWLLDLYANGRLKLDELITKYRPLEEINEAFDDLTKGVTARTVLTFD